MSRLFVPFGKRFKMWTKCIKELPSLFLRYGCHISLKLTIVADAPLSSQCQKRKNLNWNL